jgi:small subunit ribosomal protein S18
LAKREKRDRSQQRKFMPRRRRKPCIFCVDKRSADYKDVEFIKKFMTDRGKIAPRRSSGCCAKHQRMIMREIKKARHVGMVPHTVD